MGRSLFRPGVIYAGNVHYAAQGAIDVLKLGNGAFETTTYNGRLQMTDLKLGSASGGADLWRLQNGFPGTGNNGNIMSQTLTLLGGAAIGTQYRYDGVNRLLLANENPTSSSNPACPDAGSNWCQQYQYLPGNGQLGNRAVQYESGSTFTIGRSSNYNAGNRITDADFAYDSRGNLTSSPGVGSPRGYAYDGENRQIGFCTADAGSCPTAPGAGRTQYGYDGEGRRVTKTDQSGTMVFVYDARGRLAAEYGGPTQTPGTQYLTVDHLGSTRIITDASKTVVECKDYLPFGEEIPSSLGRTGIACYTADFARQKFTAKERDAETGLDYFIARFFSSAGGRFTSPDPENASALAYPDDPQSWNGYTYARNNPLLYSDPDGMVYRVCQRDDDGKEANCTFISDAAFGNFQEQNKNTLTFTGKGQISTNGNQIGTFQQVSVDLDPMAAQTLSMAGQMANAQIKQAAQQMAINAAGVGAGRLIGLGIETLIGARLAGTTAAGLSPGTVFNAGRGVLGGEAILSGHAAQQAAARGITSGEIAEALSHVPKQFSTGSVVRFIGTAAEVRVNRITGTIVTVIRKLSPAAPSPIP